MASASQVPIQWKTEDDLLLKNSLEAGASLEALAKGAVQFSRRFTLQELRDRWISLLYDPNVSEQAAKDMFALEYYGTNHATKSSRIDNNVNNEHKFSKKRKSDSIRRKYYAMRKKFRSDFFSSSDLGFFEPNAQEFSGHGTDFQKQVTVGDDVSDHLRLHEEDLDILRHAFPDTIQDDVGCSSSFKDKLNENITSGLAESGNSVMEVKENPSGSINPFSSNNPDDFASYDHIMYASDHSPLVPWRAVQDESVAPEPVNMILEDTATISRDVIPDQVEVKENSSAVCAGEFADPDSLLNLSNDDEIVLVGVDEKDAGQTISEVDYPGGVQQQIDEVEPENALEVSTALSSVNPVVSEAAMSLDDDQKSSLQPEFDEPSKPITTVNSGEFNDGKICCMFNTENTEIPCNDDIFLLIHPSSSFDPFSTQPHSSVSMGPHDFHENEAELRKLGLDGLEESLYLSPFGGHDTKIEMLDSKHQALHAGFINKCTTDSSRVKGRSLYLNSKLSIDGLMEKEEAKVGEDIVTVCGVRQSMEASSSRLPESVVDSSASDKEEAILDDDVPYFSDVEAMILDLDLDACDRDFQVTKHVPSFQHAETKRAIVRLEQCARSCLQRAMTSKGALAILYGRNLKYYIRKTEVLLGRSTDEIEVDIDLRKEGRANKISRRQAKIKIEADGSFFLKNLGKGSVYVNGIAVVTGQSFKLSSSCLIEIKGMSFVFEINQRYVTEQLGKHLLEK